MASFEKKIENSFFLITSHQDLGQVKSRLYGICYAMEGIYKDVDILEEYYDVINSEQSGCFVAIKNKTGRIVLVQDCCFSLYIYYYQCNGYWAVSNSFWQLCDEVKKHYALTIDDTFFEQYSSENVTPLSLNRTFANEIKVCPFGYNMAIDISTRSLNIYRNDRCMDKLTKKVPLDSTEGMKQLDEWIAKWASIIKGIANTGYEIKFDLTGGFDSRITFALAVASGMNFDSSRIHVYSRRAEDSNGDLIEDYRISSQIANEFGFELSEQYNLSVGKRIRGKDAYEIYRHVLSNIHLEPYTPRYYYPKPVFYLNGLNGEVIRGWKNREGFINGFSFPIGTLNQQSFPVSAWKEIVEDWNSLPVFSEDINLNEIERNRYFMLAVRGKTHMSSVMYQNNILNYWQVTNFSDVDMLNIMTPNGYEPTVIMAVILSRIDKKLLSIPISDNRCFSKKEIEYAEYIKNKYPINISISELKLVLVSDDFELEYDIDYRDDIAPEKLLYERFISDSGKKLFISHFGKLGELMYSDADNNYERTDIRFSNRYIAAIGTAMEMLGVQNESGRYYGDNRLRDDLIVLQRLVENCPDSTRMINAYRELRELKKQSIALGTIVKKIHNNNKKIALWGCGICGKKWLRIIENSKITIDYVVDGNPNLQGTVINGFVVRSYKEIEKEVDIIFITVQDPKSVEEIKNIARGKMVLELNEWWYY